ncbi:HIT family protein [Salidesulfovibrio brasiliensis]|uniref:HIT family protein n=1 Tax=Salidesulfovibrio brasiliensis TaxID=221711 RepID=UPI0006D2B30C|nr:HIT family protein [Salidesulfovibrio brasiliensis]
MAGECLFCKIVAGEIPCAKVYESETMIGFLDIAPVNAGHALVLPKAHHPTLWEMPAELGNDLMQAVKAVADAVKAETGADGLNVMQNNYEAAGQLVPHVHFHLIPRFDNDGLKLWPQESYKDPEEMRRLAEAIAARTQ